MFERSEHRHAECVRSARTPQARVTRGSRTGRCADNSVAATRIGSGSRETVPCVSRSSAVDDGHGAERYRMDVRPYWRPRTPSQRWRRQASQGECAMMASATVDPEAPAEKGLKSVSLTRRMWLVANRGLSPTEISGITMASANRPSSGIWNITDCRVRRSRTLPPQQGVAANMATRRRPSRTAPTRSPNGRDREARSIWRGGVAAE